MRQTSLLIQQPWERLDWWEVDRRTALWAVEETARGHIFARRCFTVWLYLPGLTGGQAVGWRGPRRIINTTSARDSICPWGRMDNISCFEAKTGKIRNGWFMSSSFLFFFSYWHLWIQFSGSWCYMLSSVNPQGWVRKEQDKVFSQQFKFPKLMQKKDPERAMILFNYYLKSSTTQFLPNLSYFLYPNGNAHHN